MVGDLGVPQVTVETFRADARDCWAEMPERSAREIREVATLRTLERYGLAHELDRMMEMFFEVRFANSRPYDGVIDKLEKLRPEYQLGYATNANSEAHLCGLKDQFAFEIYALRTGIPKKPAVAFYAAVAEIAGNSPEEIVYVGDSYEHDIVGPAAYGMRTVWLNKKGQPVPGQTQPDAVIDSLMDLPRILGGWR
jgi:putative hydrolase of the HAD superfamily